MADGMRREDEGQKDHSGISLSSPPPDASHLPLLSLLLRLIKSSPQPDLLLSVSERRQRQILISCHERATGEAVLLSLHPLLLSFSSHSTKDGTDPLTGNELRAGSSGDTQTHTRGSPASCDARDRSHPRHDLCVSRV